MGSCCSKKQTTKEVKKKSIYDRIGGAPALESVIRKFYVYMLADERVKKFFESTNMEA